MPQKINFGSATFGSIVACFALVFASLVTGAISFESRHLATASLAQKFIAFGVAFLPALSTFVVSYFKLFAVGSKTHDKWLWVCMGLDLTALLLQGLGVAAREVGGNDGLLQTFNIASYTAAALSALAIGIAAGTSDHRLAAVDAAESERELVRTRYQLRKGVLENDQALLQEIAQDERNQIRAQNKFSHLQSNTGTQAPRTPLTVADVNNMTIEELLQHPELVNALIARANNAHANGGGLHPKQ